MKSVVRKYGIFTAGGVTQSAPQNVHYVFGTPGNGIPSASNLNAQAAYTWDGHTEYLSGGVWYATDVNTQYPIAAETFGNDVAALWNGMPPNSSDWVDQSGNGLFGYVAPGGGSTAGLAQVGTESFAYDVEGDMLSASNTVAGSNTPVAAYTYQYDSSGDWTAQQIQLAGVSEDVVLTAGSYNNGNRTGLAANIGGTLNADGTVSNGINDFQDTFAYDPLGNMIDVTQTSQPGQNSNAVSYKNVTLTYDADNRLTNVARYASPGTNEEVAASTYTYDADSRLTALSYSLPAGSTGTAPAYQWTYDADSRLLQELSAADATAGYAAGETDYVYYATSQLASTSYTNFANKPESNTSENYDLNGNCATTPPSGANSAVGAGNRVLFDGTYYYQYDPAGNRIARWIDNNGHPEGSPQAGDSDVTIYQWNARNELTAVTYYASFGGAGAEIDYAYDAFAQMVSRTDRTSNTSQYFINDGGNVALVLNSSGQVLERELYGPAVDQILATENVAALSQSQIQAVGAVNWALPDNQATVRDVAIYNAATNTTSVVDHLVYDPFGQVTTQSSSSPANQPQNTYEGMWQDPTTGLDYADGVWYDPVDGVLPGGGPQADGGGGAPGAGPNVNPPTYNGPTTPPGLPPGPSWPIRPPSSGVSRGGMPGAAPDPFRAPPAVGMKVRTPGSGGGRPQRQRLEFPGIYVYRNHPAPPDPPRPRRSRTAWSYHGGDNAYDNTSAGAEGLANGATLGGANAFWRFIGVEDYVDRDSSYYKKGEVAGEILTTTVVGGAAAKGCGALFEAVTADARAAVDGLGFLGDGGEMAAADTVGVDFGVDAAAAEGDAGSALVRAESAQADFLGTGSVEADVGAECDGFQSFCFPAGTPVATSTGAVPIEAIRKGNEVWAYDLVTSRWRLCRVLQTFVHDHEGASAFITVQGETIESTSGHPFWVVRGDDLANRRCPEHIVPPPGATTPGRWVEAGDVRLGDELLLRDGRIVPVQAVRHEPFKGKVYNFSVAELESYAVANNNVLVHNSSSQGGEYSIPGGAPLASEGSMAEVNAAIDDAYTTGKASALEIDGQVFPGRSTLAGGGPLNQAVLDVLPDVPEYLRDGWFGDCAELRSLSGAFDAGVNPAGGTIVTRFVGGVNSGVTVIPCPACRWVLRNFGVAY